VNTRTTVAALVAAALLLSGCSANDPLAEQYQSGSGQGYVSGDGLEEIRPGDRDAPVAFEGESIEGETVGSAELAGSVTVVNFWYAACPPCRLEAPILAQLSEEYDDVAFVGVNTRDYADQARIFEQEYGIGYPSILDVDSASVQLAFAGEVPPNAVPTTLVLDREGRVAARISGVIEDDGILAAMLDTVLAEAP
jgi:thiol-disulfide isomerase/thioredoxin